MKAERRDCPAEARSGRRAESIGDPPEADIETPVPDYRDGSETPAAPGAVYPRSGKLGSGRSPLKADFGPGFQFQTEDEEFRLQVHYESQIEARVWGQGDQVPAQQRLLPAPPADLLQRQHHQADRVRVLDQPRARQPSTC